MATTNFENLCASKPLAIHNAFFDESRAAKPASPMAALSNFRRDYGSLTATGSFLPNCALMKSAACPSAALDSGNSAKPWKT